MFPFLFCWSKVSSAPTPPVIHGVCVCVCSLRGPPSSRLFAVGAGAGDSAEPFALPARRLHVLVSHLNTQVVQVAGVQRGIPAQLPLLRVWLFLYLDTWAEENRMKEGDLRNCKGLTKWMKWGVIYAQAYSHVPAGLFASSPCEYWTPVCVIELTVTVWRLGRLTWPVWPRGRVWTGAKVNCWAWPWPWGSWSPWSDWTPWT